MNDIRRIVELTRQWAAIKRIALPDELKGRDKREPARRAKEQAEDAIAGVMNRIFRIQRDRFVSRLQARTGRKAVFDPDDWDYVFDDTTPDMQKQMATLTALLMDMAQVGITQYALSTGLQADWSLTNAEAARWASTYSYDLIKDIDATSKAALQKAVTAFVETPGMTVGDLSAALPFDAQRAFMIAVTETTRAYAEGQSEAMNTAREQFPDVPIVKEWFTNEDDLVCDICGALNGQMVKDEAQFTDDNGVEYDKPPAHPRCRCWTDYRTRING